jgi:hypothetical protein
MPSRFASIRVAAVAGRPEVAAHILCGRVLHRRHAGVAACRRGSARDSAWGTPGAWSTGQQGAPAVCLGHSDPAIYLQKCSGASRSLWIGFFLTRKRSPGHHRPPSCISDVPETRPIAQFRAAGCSVVGGWPASTGSGPTPQHRCEPPRPAWIKARTAGGAAHESAAPTTWRPPATCHTLPA